MEIRPAGQQIGVRGTQGSLGTFVLPILLLLVALAAFWVIARPRSVPVSSGSSREAQVLEGAVHVADGKQFSAGERFGLLTVQDKTLACADPSRLRRIDDVELRLRPCRFRFVEGGIRVEGGGLQVWVYKAGTPFTTHTPSAVMGVLGTKFEVEVLPDQSTTVHVLEGTVEITAVTGGAVRRLGPGSGLRITMAGGVAAAPPLPQPPEHQPPEQQPPQGDPDAPGQDGQSQPAPDNQGQGSQNGTGGQDPMGSGSQGSPDTPGATAATAASATPSSPDGSQPGEPPVKDHPVSMDQLLDTR